MGGLATYHNNGSNFLFHDGHVEYFKAGSEIGYNGDSSSGPWRKYWTARGV
ncbi:MAG: hypothetical protein NC824_00105 [Candidatus Omnitrophica bacterium]|nr:hypothetical protein [Candidatus Omnitrophota bacterium]